MLPVAIERNDVLRTSCEGEADAGLQGRSLPEVDGMTEDDGAFSSGNRSGFVCGSVVYSTAFR